ncbi:MAG: hypothetical protein B0D92_03915 [Spirochaeta sp. LUC14_002_19_P3]|nr:MAG: hypothetical protein B0D92_03915 [Spirochaeta sp. LUC14_002_19_P3]
MKGTSNKIHALCAILICAIALAAGAEPRFEFLSFADYYGGIEPGDGYQNLRSRIFMRPTFGGIHDSSGFEWQLSANLWAQPLGEPNYINLWDIPYESYMFMPFDFFDITLGFKILSYGFSDVSGPLNVTNSGNAIPYGLTEAFDGRRPDPLLQLKFYPSFEDTIELTYIPITRPDRERGGSIALPDSNDTLEWRDDSWLTDPDTMHSLFAVYSHYGEKIDMQFFYGWYTSHKPDFLIPEMTNSIASVIKPVYRKKHTFGFAYSLRLWTMTLAQDIAFTITSDLAGTDIGAQNSELTVNTQLLVNLPWNILSQYSLVYAFFPNHNQHSVGTDSAASAYLAEEVQGFHTQPFQHIAYIITHFEKTFLREKLKTSLNIGFFFSPKIYFGPQITYNISDYWQFELGADITLLEPPDNDLRRNTANDSFYVRLLYRY